MAEHGRGRSPDRVAHELEEVDRPVERRDTPPLLPEHLVQQELGQRDEQDPLDLRRVGRSRGRPGSAATNGTMKLRLDTAVW